MPPDDTCGSQTRSRQKTLYQPCPAPLQAHGTEPSRVPEGPVCSTFTQMGLEPPERPQCTSPQPLEAGGWACKCGREAGRRVLFAQKWGRVNRWAQSLPCSNRPTSRKGICPTRTEQLLARGPGAEAAGHLVSHPSGHSVPVHVCARVGRVMQQGPRSQSQTRASRALSRAHPLEIQGLCAQRAPGPTFLAPAATHAHTAAPPPRAICWPH